ncbi:hypothetical protein [Variovorax sp. LjRoot178]|uniref:hypothetical protein n=1 Tax=Variovorax sp. LjRoot178 TaxID=3342277 RepID=UPI003ECEDBA2
MRLEVDPVVTGIGGHAGPLQRSHLHQRTLAGAFFFDPQHTPRVTVSFDGTALPYTRTLRTATIRAFEAPQDDDASDQSDEHQIIHGSLGVEYDADVLRTTVLLWLPRSVFKELWNPDGEEVWLSVSAAIQHDLGSQNEWDSTTLFLSNGQVQKEMHNGSDRRRHFAEKLEQDLHEALSGEYLVPESQAGKIAYELAAASAAAVLRGESASKLHAQAREILGFARSVFRSSLQLEGAPDPNVFCSEADRLRHMLASRSDSDATRLRSDFDELWRHCNPCSPEAAGLNIRVDELEQLADDLLKNTQLASSLLEWAIIDALVFLACVDSGEKVSRERESAGLPRDGSAEPKKASRFWTRTVEVNACMKVLERERLLASMNAFSAAVGRPDFPAEWALEQCRVLINDGAAFSSVAEKLLKRRARVWAASGSNYNGALSR